MNTRLLPLVLAIASCLCAAAQIKPHHPDMDAIRAESLNPSSRYYYPRLLRMFMSNDTVMTADDYRHFYYGTLFQEDYDPYRTNPYEAQLRQVEPLYFKTENLTRAERQAIEDLSRKSLENNPLDLRQLMYRVYVYEQNKKYNLAKIWKHKLDNILLTIANSGTGNDTENAWVVVYPSHEFDFFNIPGGSVESQEFIPPYYEKLTVRNKKGDKSTEHYFNLHHMLEQYYLKHPEELNGFDNVPEAAPGEIVPEAGQPLTEPAEP